MSYSSVMIFFYLRRGLGSSDENLACISRQLKQDRLLRIVKQLKKVRSSSIRDLKLLVSRVKSTLEETKSNLGYLDLVLQSCKSFDNLNQIQECLPRILHIIRFVWASSPYYNEP